MDAIDWTSLGLTCKNSIEGRLASREPSETARISSISGGRNFGNHAALSAHCRFAFTVAQPFALKKQVVEALLMHSMEADSLITLEYSCCDEENQMIENAQTDRHAEEAIKAHM